MLMLCNAIELNQQCIRFELLTISTENCQLTPLQADYGYSKLYALVIPEL